VKFLTIRQPWASLIAVGAKTIETRPFSTKYRGPLAIHAGLAKPEHLSWVGQWSMHTKYLDPGEAAQMRRMVGVGQMGGGAGIESVTMPLGAVVAVCDLVDVVPIRLHTDPPDDWRDEDNPDPGAWLSTNPDTGTPTLYHHRAPAPHGGSLGEWMTDQLPFGDFTPGRYAWLLDNVRPIEPVPMKGAQGLRDVPDDIRAALDPENGGQ
jgi:hypothetical protein